MTTHICNNPNTSGTGPCRRTFTDPAVSCGVTHRGGIAVTAAPAQAPVAYRGHGGVAGYTFAADTYCVDCILSVLPEYHTDGMVGDTRDVHGVVDVDGALWDVAIDSGVDREDEYSFDSDDFPKVILQGMTNESTECGKCSASIG